MSAPETTMFNSEAETDSRILSRDCDAISVPWGQPETLPAGAYALVTQRLGNSITVMCGGNLYRVAERDADALGLEPRPEEDFGQLHPGELSAEVIEQNAWKVLGSCYDPEIPIDIVNLGLVYGCSAEHLSDGGYRLSVRMTLTAPGCGMGTFIADEAREKLLQLPGVEEAYVDLVWDPPWSREMMSEAARLEMGMF